MKRLFFFCMITCVFLFVFTACKPVRSTDSSANVFSSMNSSKTEDSSTNDLSSHGRSDSSLIDSSAVSLGDSSIRSAGSSLTAPDTAAQAHVSITGTDGAVIILPRAYIVTPQTTAFDLLRTACRDQRVGLHYSENGEKIEITNIDELRVKQFGKDSGWIFRINGVFAQWETSCAEVLVSAGDTVDFLYTKDGGTDIGAN